MFAHFFKEDGKSKNVQNQDRYAANESGAVSFSAMFKYLHYWELHFLRMVSKEFSESIPSYVKLCVQDSEQRGLLIPRGKRRVSPLLKLYKPIGGAVAHEIPASFHSRDKIKIHEDERESKRGPWKATTWDRWDPEKRCEWSGQELLVFDLWAAGKNIEHAVRDAIDLLEGFPAFLQNLEKEVGEKNRLSDTPRFLARLLVAVLNIWVVEMFVAMATAGIKPETIYRETFGIAMVAMGLYYMVRIQNVNDRCERGQEAINELSIMPVPGCSMLSIPSYSKLQAKEQTNHLIKKKCEFFKLLGSKLEAVKTDEEKIALYQTVFSKNISTLFLKKARSQSDGQSANQQMNSRTKNGRRH